MKQEPDWFMEHRSAAINEALQKFHWYYKDAEKHTSAVYFALGLFTGIILRMRDGAPDPDPADACLACDGDGKNMAATGDPQHPLKAITCPECNGTGKRKPS